MKLRIGRNRHGGSGGLSPADTLFAAFSVDPGETRKGLYTDLINSLIGDGIWDKLDALYVFAAHDAADSRINIKSPGTYDATETGATCTHTTDRGYTFSGTGCLNTGFNPATASSPQWALDSATLMAYVNATSAETTSNKAVIGTASGITNNFLRNYVATNGAESRINSASTMTSGLIARISRKGAVSVSRTGANSSRFIESILGQSPVRLQTSTSVLNDTFLIGCMGTDINDTDRIAAVAIGGGLTDAEQADLQNAIHVFLANIGANWTPYSTDGVYINVSIYAPTVEVGELMSLVDVGSWDFTTTLSYQWMRDSVPISGATNNNYVLQTADIGAMISCNITPTNSAGSLSAYGPPAVGPVVAGGYDSDAAALFALMVTDPGATRKGHYNDLIVGLKADSLWTKIDALYIFAAHEHPTSGTPSNLPLYNIKSPGTYNASEVNSPTWTTDLGFKCTGTAYLDTNFNPTTAVTPNFVRDSCCLYGYVNQVTSDAGATTPIAGNSNGAGTLLFLRPRNASDFIDCRIHSTAASSFSSVTTRLGGTSFSRTGSAASQGYRNGTAIGASSTAASAAPTNHNVLLMRWNTTYNTNDRLAAAVIAGGLNSTEQSNLHSRITTFLTAIGAN